jgi:adenylate cyclase
MTILFADLVGFTGLSERLTGSLMVTLLNRHFGLQALAIQEHQGVVDKFIGDSVMAFWGPPFTRAEDHALLACRAAWGQLAALDVLRRELPELTGLRKDAPAIDLGIGVCTGEVIVGNIGSENIRSYTVIGDTVNLAARIERANRTYGTKILLSETTAQTLSPHFETREIDTIAVKGKTESTRVFELLGPTAKVSADSLRHICGSFVRLPHAEVGGRRDWFPRLPRSRARRRSVDALPHATPDFARECSPCGLEQRRAAGRQMTHTDRGARSFY